LLQHKAYKGVFTWSNVYFKLTSNFTCAPVSNIITLLPFFIEMIQYDWL